MKKFLSAVLCVMLVMTLLPAAMADSDVKIVIDGQQLIAKDANGTVVYPIIKEGTTYLPVRAIGQAFGKAVDWDEETNTVFVGDKGDMLQLYTETVKIVIDGVTIDPRDADGNSVAPFIENGTTYLPVRAIGEAFGKNVAWDSDTRGNTVSVILTTPTEFVQMGELDGGYFRIYQSASELSLAVENGSGENSAKLVVADYADNNSQVWSFSAVGDGYYSVINRGSGKSIDIPSSNKDAGTAVTQYDSNGGGNQLVKAVKNDDETYSFEFKHSGLYLTAGERYLTQEEYVGDDSQRFRIEFIEDSLMKKVLTSPGYEALGEKAERFKAYLYSPISFSRNVKAQAESLLTSNNYLDLDAEAQKELLLQCMQLTAYSQISMGNIPNESNATYDITNIEYNESYDVWRGTMKPVWIYSVVITDESGQTQSLEMISTVEAASGTEEASIPENAIKAVSRFPYAVRKHLNYLIYRNDEANSYNGGGDTIWMRVNWVPNVEQMAGTLAHELGHVLDSNLSGDETIWERAIEADAVPMSGYGNSNRTEDLAEYSRLYHSVKNDSSMLKIVEEIYPNRAKAFQALLYASDREYYSQYKNSFFEISGLDTENAQSGYLVSGGKYVSVNDTEAGSSVAALDDADSKGIWTLYPTSDGYYVAFNEYSGLCLNVPGNSKDEGKNIIQWNGGTGDNEKMSMEENADGTFKLRFKDSGLYLAVSGDSVIQSAAGTSWKLSKDLSEQ